MRPRSLSALALVPALAVLLLPLGDLVAADSRARIIFRDGTQVDASEVTEGEKETVYVVAGDTASQKRQTVGIERIDYVGLHGGDYAAGRTALAAGKLDEAVERFRTLAGGDAHWQVLYGNLALGDALEQRGDHAAAATAFRAAQAVALRPRLNLDTTYRLGMALAQAQDPAASALADTLMAQAKGKTGVPFEARANAIRAAMAVDDANSSLEVLAKKVALKPAEDGAVYYHFQRWLGTTWLRLNKPKEAFRLADAVLSAMPRTSDQRAAFLAIRAKAAISTDPSLALIDAARIDLAPGATEQERAEARLLAGKLLLRDAEQADKDPTKAPWAADQRKGARLLLQAAIDHDPASPTAEEATRLLATVNAP